MAIRKTESAELSTSEVSVSDRRQFFIIIIFLFFLLLYFFIYFLLLFKKKYILFLPLFFRQLQQVVTPQDLDMPVRKSTP